MSPSNNNPKDIIRNNVSYEDNSPTLKDYSVPDYHSRRDVHVGSSDY